MIEIFLIIKVVSMLQSILEKLTLGRKCHKSRTKAWALIGKSTVLNIHLADLSSAATVFLAAAYIFCET